MALPVLLYSIEAVRLNKSELLALNHPWERTFQKIFHSFDSQIIMLCQFFTGYLPVLHYFLYAIYVIFEKAFKII